MPWQDFRVAVRGLRRSPGFALTCILTVAAAVGMATSVFSVVNAVLLRPLPYHDAGRLAMIWSSSENNRRGSVPFDDLEDWRRVRGQMTLMVRAKGDANALAAAVRKAVFAADAEQPVFDVKPLEQIVSNTIAARRWGVWLLAIFAFQRLVGGRRRDLRRSFVFG
jgi:hypothetical protein